MKPSSSENADSENADSEDADDAARRQRKLNAPQSANAGFALFNRSRSMGNSGLQAASIGWVLAGCVFFGYFAGSWLDGYFKTQFWMPILVLLGIAAAFREMFVTLKQLQDAQQAEKARAQHEKARRPTAQKLRLSDETHDNRDAVDATTEAKVQPPKRLFRVPAPPTASYEARPKTDDETTDAEIARQKQLNTEEILRALQDETQDEETNKQQL